MGGKIDGGIKGIFTVAQLSCRFNLGAKQDFMQTMLLGVSSLRVSRLAYGCWRVAGSWDQTKITAESRAAGHRAIIAAYEAGYTLFDNADIYSAGEAEKIFGEVLKEVSGMRARVLIATKCGIRPAGTPHPHAPQRYDFSESHIIESCEQSLKRLQADTIHLYMLLRPDFLADPQEIAGAFSRLQASGKVRYFGVSNFRPTLVTALQAACPMPLIVNQVEISLAKLDAFTDGTLDQCLIERITPMAWSPLAAGLIGAGAHDLLPSQKSYRTEALLPALDAVAKERGAARITVALAWLLKHPSRIQPIVGSIHPDRIRLAAKADELELSREEWYRLLLAARGEPLP
jgi:predicted oxidoreductase